MADDKPHLSLVPTGGEPEHDGTLVEPTSTPGAEAPVALSQELRRQYKWAVLFLEAFRNSGNVRAAAKVAGVGRTTVYHARNTVPEFAEAFDAAEDDAVDHIDAAVYNRAIPGGDDPMLRHLHKVRMTSQELRRKRLEEARVTSGGQSYRVVIMDEGPAPPQNWIGEPIDGDYRDLTPGQDPEEADDAGDDRRSDTDTAPAGPGGDGAGGDDDRGAAAETDGGPEDPPETVG